jgi:hypothetical protein
MTWDRRGSASDIREAMSWTRPRLRSRTTLATQGLFGRALTQPSRTYMVLAQVLSNDEANMKPAVLGCLDAQDH